MTRINRFLLATASFSLVIPSLVAQPATNRGPEKPAPAVSNALTVERVSVEPDADERARSLHWSPDGASIAWMQLLRPSAKARQQVAQQEIWTVASSVQPSPGHESAQMANPSKREPALLVSAEKITAALRGSNAPHHNLADDGDNNNPYLLQDFAWSPDHASLLLIGAQSLAWLDLATGKARTLISGAEAISDAAISPDGQTVSFIRSHGLMLVDIKEGAKPRALLSSAHDDTHEDLLEGELDWPAATNGHPIPSRSLISKSTTAPLPNTRSAPAAERPGRSSIPSPAAKFPWSGYS
jgi:hypothetical protein